MKVPLAEKMRPQALNDVIGQDQILNSKSPIRRSIEHQEPLSLLFWGPPGSGKTTIARLYAKSFNCPFYSFSAVRDAASEIKQLLQKAKNEPLFKRQIMLFVDEIHRLNKAQQDIFLPYLEEGSVILLAATTENPSFSVNNALLSRLRVLEVKHLDRAALYQILERVEKGVEGLPLDDKAREYLIEISHGDGRHLLNMIENLMPFPKEKNYDQNDLLEILQKRTALYDRDKDQHYNLISALHKSVRGSDPDAALYWFSRMIKAGESVQFLARRIIRMASEDIGLADPQALDVVLSAYRAYEQLGSPEGELALAQAVVYLALAPKSNALYRAFAAAGKNAEESSELSPPKTILNSPTKVMKDLGYGKGYLYDHDQVDGFSGQDYFPEDLGRQSYYQPREVGFEREMKKRLSYFSRLREEKNR